MINLNIKNTNIVKKKSKWNLIYDDNDNERIKKKINGYLNKFTDKNYINIYYNIFLNRN